MARAPGTFMDRTVPPDEDVTKSSAGAHPHPPRILVVEDDVAFAEVVRFELAAGGYEVVLTSSVSEAQRRMRDDDLDLVISDVRLPGKTGLQLLFPEGADTKPTPILMMSAFLSPKLRKFVEGMGAAVLEKPFTFANLHLSVIRVLREAARVTTTNER
jgi:DNA-binding response OmpR family regulator